MWCSKGILLSGLPKRKGFSLPEVMAALTLLAFVSSSVVVVISRCVTSAAEATLRMQAFEVARDNVEKLLTSDSVKEMAEYGQSDKYPDIGWQTVVETFYEPVTNRMWVRGICTAEYTDTEDQTQKVELTHWLANLTKQQILQIAEEKQKEMERLAEAGQIIETLEEAAEYIGVDVPTIEQWVKNGMLKTEDGGFIKSELELYEQTGGKPTIEDRQRLMDPDADFTESPGGERQPDSGQPDGTTEPKAGLPWTEEELNNMSTEEAWQKLVDWAEF